MAQETVELIREAYEAFNQEGPEALYPLLDPKVEWENPPDSPDHRVFHGHDGVATWHRDFLFAQFESVRIYPQEFFDLGDRVLVLCRAAVRARASGLEMEIPFAHLLTIRDGKATNVRMFSDQAEALDAAGVPRKRDSAGG